MSTCWSLHLVPTKPDFVPSAAQFGPLMDYLAKSTGVTGGYEIGDDSDLSPKEVAVALAAAKKDIEAAVLYTDDMKSDVLFGWDPDEGDDEYFWAGGLTLELSKKAKDYVDLEYPKIPGRSARFSIAFTGNNGWNGDPADAKRAFKDKKFLPGLEKILGIPLAVVAISS